MKKLRTHLLAIGAVLGVAAVITALTATTTIAQTVRAALVKNVDEPGLVPFSQTFSISTTACGCSNCCFPETAPVAAGKRLVIQNVSGFFPINAVGNMGPITIQEREPSPTFGIRTILTLPVTFRTQWNGGDYPAWEFNQMTLAYVDAGKTARLSIFTGASWSFNTGQVTVNGYLVSLQ